MGDMEHKILNYFEHLWPYVSGVFLFFVAAFKLWLHDRKEAKEEVRDLRLVVLKMEKSMVTKDDLDRCSTEKDKQHISGIKDVLNELHEVRSEGKNDSGKNQSEHKEIINIINEKHSDTMKTMMRLHAK